MTKTTTIPMVISQHKSKHFNLTVHATCSDPDTLSPRNSVLLSWNPEELAVLNKEDAIQEEVTELLMEFAKTTDFATFFK